MSPIDVLTVSASLSARRAWIEICICPRLSWLLSVALRKESVDRNKACITIITTCTASLSARRAWIEIALLNAQNRHLASRSPQGERG